MNLSQHFTLEELLFSSCAQRNGIDNSPSPQILANLKVLAYGLEHVRGILGNPMHIDSGYRCEALNKAVGGSKTSAHMEGYAADFTCHGFGSPAKIAREIAASNLMFDQCIQEGNWVHISFNPKARRQVLTAHFGPAGVSYTMGA